MGATITGPIKSAPHIFSFNYIRVLLRGTAQVMFQENAWSGFFIMCGIFWGSYENHIPAVAWGACLGLLVSTLTGRALRLPKNDGIAGLWGFNGILVGCAFPTFLGNSYTMWIGLIFCAALTTWVRRAFNKVLLRLKVNSFTFPFVFCTWVFLLAARYMKGLDETALSNPELIYRFTADVNITFGNLVIYWLKGVSQVFLVNSWVTGLFFLVGLFFNSYWAGIWAMVSSAIALAMAVWFQAPGDMVSLGLFAFSPVLTGIALGCTFYKTHIRTSIWALLGIVATVFVQAGMDAYFTPYGIPTLTGPFCVTTWLFLLPRFKFTSIKNRWIFEKEQGKK